MPSLVRKLLIFAAVDGLILQPAPPKHHPPSTQQAIKIDWKGNVAPLLKDRRTEDTGTGLEAWGVVGLLKVASTRFLISIATREQVAQIRGKPIYVISDVALIPLASQAEAEKAITLARDSLKRSKAEPALDEEDSSDEDDGTATVSDDESLPENIPPSPWKSLEKDPLTGRQRERRTSVGQDVIARKGLYGRFADAWFSRKGWSAEGRQRQGMSSEDDLLRKREQAARTSEEQKEREQVDDNTESTEPKKDQAGIQEALKLDPQLDEEKEKKEDTAPDVAPEEIPKALGEADDSSSIALLPKILRTTKIYFGSKSFYFSYDIDLSRRLSNQPLAPSNQSLFKQFDPLYFWNQHMIEPLIESGQHSFVLPIIQGFVGQRAFTVDTSQDSSESAVVKAADSLKAVLAKHDESAKHGDSQDPKAEKTKTKDFLLTLVSRRSIKRAGLRYLRRGIDGEGNVANGVESEQLLSTPTWDTSENQIYSFTQCRGSIPLYFSQSPYSLKPWPVLHGSPEMNAAAFKLHFANLAARYGKVQAVSLVDKHGSEAKIGEGFENNAKALNENGGYDGRGTEIGFEWFDFHNVCRGMRFENVSQLMDTLGPFMTSSGWTVQQGDQLTETQSGILRINCMDCLDRTNVVQSACARSVLEAQLSAQGIPIDLQTDPRTSWFNTLWADNGDAISKQYSGTAALKGDYTRTRHRKITGALTDFGLTLTRYYNNIVNDYFAQALIDYLLGRAPASIFADFEADMKTQDYAIDLAKTRQAAIDRCAALVVADPDEDLLAGWTLSCPAAANTLRALPFEECVLLLTEAALYACRLDWATEKVSAFERVPLQDIRAVQRGPYITSTLAARHLDTAKNVGLVVRYRPDRGGELVRRNTRSLDSSEHADPELRAHGSVEGAGSEAEKNKGAGESGSRILAFKALPPPSSSGSSNAELLSEVQMTRHIAEEIARVADRAKERAAREEQRSGTETESVVLEERDIIGVAEAKRATGYLEQWGYNLKRLVWT